MPEVSRFCCQVVGGEVVVSYGARVLAVYERGDRGMRNLAVVSLTRAGVPGVEVARLFGIRPEHVSRLRRQAQVGGSAGLVPPLGRPRALDAAGAARAHTLSDDGRSGAEIAVELGVSEATISRVLARRPGPEPEQLDLGGPLGGQGSTVADGQEQPDSGDDDDANSEDDSEEGEQDPGRGGGLARIADGDRSCAYAGAMLLHGFLGRVGAGAVLGCLPSGSARRYDATGLVLSAMFGFALGASSAEGTKHLLGADAGALIGSETFPHLRTLRPRLGALADVVDPLAVQTALAKAMLDADDEPVRVFFVDDHFVAYTGQAPVAKGWNTRRRHAEPGRDDTVIVDDRWRAICFTSGAPSGLSKTMWGPLDQLQAICKDRPAMIGFDRGGAYPKVFAELNRRGLDWVTYRRAPLAAPAVAPTRSWAVGPAGCRHHLTVADETVTLKGVGPARQISIIEQSKVVLQILTSDTTTTAARLARTLRGRWCIENTFKYLEDHHGIHWLCDYHKDLGPDPSTVPNPARVHAKTAVASAETAVVDLEQQIGNLTTTRARPETLAHTNTTLRRLQRQLEPARAALTAAHAALKQVPAKIPATTLDPDATRATPRTNRRALQMVCRLLAYNAELDLARALNMHLDDPDEYRAITRNLLHQPGQVAYTPTSITVTIRQPDAPRITHALTQLIDHLNQNPPHLTGDHRPITYKIGPKP